MKPRLRTWKFYLLDQFTLETSHLTSSDCVPRIVLRLQHMVVFILVSEFFGKNFLVLFLDSFEISEQHLILSRILKGFLRRFLFGFQAFITALVNFTCSIYDLKHCTRAIRKLYVNTPAQLCAIKKKKKKKMLVCVLEMLINYRKSHSILVLRQMCLKADQEIGFITFRTISRRRA